MKEFCIVFFCALTVAALFFLLGYGVGGNKARASFKPLPPTPPLYEIEQKCRAQVRAEAAKAGVAYYELNHKTGEIEFHYVDLNKIIQSVVAQMQMQQREALHQELQ